jgi:hypothetical protein
MDVRGAEKLQNCKLIGSIMGQLKHFENTFDTACRKYMKNLKLIGGTQTTGYNKKCNITDPIQFFISCLECGFRMTISAPSESQQKCTRSRPFCALPSIL